MRIAQLVDSLAIGGAERVAADLSIELGRRGHQLHVVCLRQSGPLAGALQEAGIPAAALHKAAGFRWSAAWRLGRYLARERIEILHSHNPFVHHYAVLGAQLARVPVVVNTLHGLRNLSLRGGERWLFQASCLPTHRLVGVCAEAAAALDRERWLAPRPLLVIPNGTPLHKFAAIEPRRKNGEFVFGTVARLSAEKDQHTLLRAFALVLRSGRRAQLRLLGNGPERESLERLAEQLDIGRQTVFEGESLHVAQFLAGLDTFVLSSRSEALPLSLLEAMAAALPVVTTAVGGVPETVRAASCGWLCGPGDPEALALAMLAAMDCPDRLSLGLRGRRHVLLRHSVERMASGYEMLFANLLADSEQAAGQAQAAALGS